jgi:hypothetical protein
MPGAVPAHPVYGAMQDWLNAGRGRTIHFHWVENGSAYVLPGQPPPARHVIDATYQRALLTTDYKALATSLQRFEAAMWDRRAHHLDPRPISAFDGDRPVNCQTAMPRPRAPRKASS